ncbi:Mycolic acid cyclopropane synthase [Macleaya cordata]|uniref:Mycolic acid cyclopropane synthase n=1 Tax=Macleaya cordata TaxID=56857 RepID=A0A200QD22_MACCD|nr:Mycolic acid cyclopropane synthase [Macleaya cordata]
MDLMAKQAKKEELLKRMELGLVPDEEIRNLVRIELEKRLKRGHKPTHQQLSQLLNLVQSVRKMEIAMEMENLDLKLYEAPFSFLQIKLGSTFKQSCSYFKDESTTLDEAEIAMLDLYIERAQIKDGQSVLDIGCGLGAVTLHIAKKYKNCNITGITNSVEQKKFIEGKCKELKLSNVKVILADVTTHESEDKFDRVFAIGMIEHMKNYELLLRMISKWMKDDGLLFIEHICHKTLAYNCEPVDEDDWFTEYVFPAGTLTVSSASLLLYFQDDVSVVDHWTLSGKHFSRSHEEWLKRIDSNIGAVKEIMKSITKSEEEAVNLVNFWRIFCICGVEQFGYNDGEEWMMSHILFKKK